MVLYSVMLKHVKRTTTPFSTKPWLLYFTCNSSRSVSGWNTCTLTYRYEQISVMFLVSVVILIRRRAFLLYSDSLHVYFNTPEHVSNCSNTLTVLTSKLYYPLLILVSLNAVWRLPSSKQRMHTSRKSLLPTV